MEETAPKTKKIVVGVDFSELGDGALDAAIEMAASSGPTEIHVVFVYQPEVGVAAAYGVALALPAVVPIDDHIALLRKSIEVRMLAATKKRRALPIASIVAHVALGAPAREIVDLAARLDADVIVLGTHGRRGVRRAVLGSVAEHVVRLAGCPVFVVREKGHPESSRAPEIEPPCPACVKRRAETKGAEAWCARHAEHHARAHVYSYQGPSTDSARPWGFT